MKRHLLSNLKLKGNIILGFSISFMTWMSCASISQPTGGPKDSIPPSIISSTPKDQSIDFTGDRIKLTFDEWVQLNNPTKEMIITPDLGGKVMTKLKGKSVEIRFLQPLDSNTTYTINFQNSIQDVTEKNSLSLNQETFSFSTGNYLDSIVASGESRDILTDKEVKNTVIALYRANDTLTIFNDRPYYFTKIREEKDRPQRTPRRRGVEIPEEKGGKFKIPNLKAGEYFVYAFNDANENLKYDPQTEGIGFLVDPIRIDSNIYDLDIPLVLMDERELEIQKAVASGPYFQIGFNKYIDTFNIKSDRSLIYNLLSDNKTIQFYNLDSLGEEDSIKLEVFAMDSLTNKTDSTLYMKFRESRRKPAELEESFDPGKRKYITHNFKAEYSFSKPLKEVITDSIFFYYDSLNTIEITEEDLTFNNTRNHVTLEKNIELDTILYDSIPITEFNKVLLYGGRGAFVTIENDSSSEIQKAFTFAKEELVGSLAGSITTEEPNYIIQLLNAKYELYDQQYNGEEYFFRDLDPGEYRIRIIVDKNGNGRWDPGNILTKTPPEPVYFFKDKVIVRANWEIGNINLDF
ncbi:Ig-like domain-containing protein [Aureibacter tunicatorum]|uniref:Uncharacterized protein (DUF2141 family) n=1 Tax=Aureibacter tunicatorum TaxID=866807 RepID=A0AAE3XK65_9BACT|nr:Ig-like domain-containing protein [Aureibacter tunicatorum]MDR6237488.1 uncharacterized protein (DUF2141 family) [Aureibacter tunicatorum]BDD02522.1 hypothetical protein AUTU_00050 [Aureibacter tunicatorum]